MSGGDKSDKTEKPTPKRLRDAKKKGNVCVSKEACSSATFLTVCACFYMMVDFIYERILANFDLISRVMTMKFSDNYIHVLSELLGDYVLIATVLATTAAITVVIASFMQHGGVFSFERIKPNIETLNPVKGAKNLFSKKNFFELFKSILKTSLYGFIVFSTLYGAFSDIANLTYCGIDCLILVLSSVMVKIIASCVLVSIVISVLDYMMQHKIYIEDLMMSRDDLKREHKDVEGNPEVKQRRKEVHREILEESVERVKMADTVITNPTHFAVCIYYKKEKAPLPIVTYKAVDEDALWVRSVAQQYNIPIHENVPLAQSLYAQSEIDSFVPRKLLRLVASVLATVLDEKDLANGFK